MDIFCRGWYIFIRANQVRHFKVEMTNFWSLFKPWLHYKLAFPDVQENSQQQKRDQIKILHLYRPTVSSESIHTVAYTPSLAR
jgi:hypothetical protein